MPTTTSVWSLRVAGPIERSQAEKGHTRHREQRHDRVLAINSVEVEVHARMVVPSRSLSDASERGCLSTFPGRDLATAQRGRSAK